MSKSIEIDGSFIDRAVMDEFCKKIMIVLSNKQDYQTQNYTELTVLRQAALTSDAMDGVLNELLDLSVSKFLKEFPL